MAKAIEQNSASAALLAALKAIPQGEISGTARRSGIHITQLARLRRGESLNIQIETLKRLAIAMGKTSDELIGLAVGSTLTRQGGFLGATQVPAFLAVSRRESRVDRPQNAYLGRGAFSDFHALRSSSPLRIVFPRVAFANARATFGISHHATPESGPRAAVIR